MLCVNFEFKFSGREHGYSFLYCRVQYETLVLFVRADDPKPETPIEEPPPLGQWRRNTRPLAFC